MAAVAREAKGPVTRADLAEVERYAQTRVSDRSHQGAGRHRGDDAARRQGGGADRHRSGGQPQACRAFRRRRIPPGVRPPERQGDRTLRCFGIGLRSLSGFELRTFRRSFRRFADGAADERRGRPHHAQTQLAAGRFVPIAQRQREQVVGFRPRSGRSRFRSCGRFSRSIRR